MPARIGFAKHRKQMLEDELKRILEMFPQLGVKQAYLVGDLATDQVGPESSLELVIVQDIPGNFHRRSDFFTSHLAPTVGTTYMVYTPEEFTDVRESSPHLHSSLKKGEMVFEA